MEGSHKVKFINLPMELLLMDLMIILLFIVFSLVYHLHTCFIYTDKLQIQECI